MNIEGGHGSAVPLRRYGWSHGRGTACRAPRPKNKKGGRACRTLLATHRVGLRSVRVECRPASSALNIYYEPRASEVKGRFDEIRPMAAPRPAVRNSPHGRG